MTAPRITYSQPIIRWRWEGKATGKEELVRSTNMIERGDAVRSLRSHKTRQPGKYKLIRVTIMNAVLEEDMALEDGE